MTIELPRHIEESIAAVVQSGRFASVDDAMAEAARLLLKQVGPIKPPATDPDHDPILGLFHDDAELMDAIVAQAYRDRDTDTWRDIDV